MIFDPSNRTLTLATKDCTACYGRGTGPTVTPCPTDGRGPKGGARGCRTCNGFGRHYDHKRPVPCERCGGDPAGKSDEMFTDNAPAEAIAALTPTLRVVRQDRAGTWNEAYLGMGALWSCSDYGRAWDGEDDALTVTVRDRLTKDRTQACKVVRPYERGDQTATLVDELVIVLHRDGYKIVAA